MMKTLSRMANREKSMSHNFHWENVETVYREKRKSSHGVELRWLVNRETITNTTTKDSVTRSTLRHPGICVIVPIEDDGRIVLMHQYRYSVDGLLWELPAGTMEGREENARMIAAESPDDCARRELQEETGYEAGRWEKVCECYAMPGMSDELIHVYLARGLRKGAQSLDVGEVIDEIRAFSPQEIKAMITSGEIRDAKTIVGLFYALQVVE